jgi:tRNA (guanine10-N2)-methyltransferase
MANFEQYGLTDRFLGVILADASQTLLWKKQNLFDVILTDPPYGVREKGRKLGPKERKSDKQDEK